MKQTALYKQHQAAGAKIVDFSGWAMPLHYGSQLKEHRQVRGRDLDDVGAGIFDVSHMHVIGVTGPDAGAFLRYLLANNIDKLQQDGKALYTCMLNDQGGVIDDLIVYKISTTSYRLVLNAGTRDKDALWIRKQAVPFDVHIHQHDDLAILAIQGPNVAAKLKPANLPGFNIEAIHRLEPFSAIQLGDYFIARTGYTGEYGLEVILPSDQADMFWEQMLVLGVMPCGLGARDSLRLEAGMLLYGNDIDETTTPLESNLAWTVAWEPVARQFIGRSALERQKSEGVARHLVGLMLSAKLGVLRSHQRVLVPHLGEGQTTSGGFSPTLDCSIAMARIPTGEADHCFVDIRGKQMRVDIVPLPFIKTKA